MEREDSATQTQVPQDCLRQPTALESRLYLSVAFVVPILCVVAAVLLLSASVRVFRNTRLPGRRRLLAGSLVLVFGLLQLTGYELLYSRTPGPGLLGQTFVYATPLVGAALAALGLLALVRAVVRGAGTGPNNSSKPTPLRGAA
jgi:Mn2+/Fe2+ NRAMP family transporter